jgi:hypothetical protein
MPERARLVGLNHVALEVGDLEEALAFYGRIFELELRGRVPGMAFIDIGDQFIALSEGRTQPPDQARHFGLVVDDRERPFAPPFKGRASRSSPDAGSTFSIRGAITCRSSSTGTSSSRRRLECCKAWAWSACESVLKRSASCSRRVSIS